ncbi:MAG: 3-keto-5-aminohexanoate cleavage protein [Alphaproteobacteria bacterium]|nr:3-keto-5-aminohexanoate cleavage protein [Alphaproteobacteria bacterium]
MKTLIMAAPNGARKTKADHPSLPMTIEETVAAASDAFAAGAAMLHAHVRDDDGGHSLDAGRYRELLAKMAEDCPLKPCQITTESVGVYSPHDQARCLLDVGPEFASIAIQELAADQSPKALDFAGGVIRDAVARSTHIQFILYSVDDLALLRSIQDDRLLGDMPLDALFVLGKYNPGFTSHPDELDAFLTADRALLRSWSVCAFGPWVYDVMI